MATQQQLSDALRTEHVRKDLRGRSVRGGLSTLTSQGVQFVLQSVGTVVLARMLTPRDFGLVAMVTAITGLAVGFADLGLSEATIQRQELSKDEVTALFWVNVGVGLGLTLCTAALAPVLAWLYNEPRLINISLVLSVSFLLGGLKVQHDALLKRQMRFFALAVRDVLSYAVAVPLAIAMAWRGAGYWAVVALPLIMSTVRVTLTWFLVRWIPGIPRRGTKIGPLLGFGGKVATSYVIYNLNRSADGVLIGWHWGAVPLGLYSRAYNLLMLPVRQLGTPLGNVLVPALSRLQSEPERFARYYLRTVSLLLWIGSPLFGFLFVAAYPVITLTLGRQWLEAAPVFRILSISALGQLLLDVTIWSFVSRGHSDRLLKLLIVTSPIVIGSFAVGLPFGIKGVALSGSVVWVGMLPWVLKFAFRGTVLTLPRLGQAVVYPISLCLIGILSGCTALRLYDSHSTILQLLIAAGGFIVPYSLSIAIPGVRMEIRTFMDLVRGLRVAGAELPAAMGRDQMLDSANR